MNQQTFRFVVRCPVCSMNLRYANSEILNALLLRCPDCSHSFIAKCEGAKQAPIIESPLIESPPSRRMSMKGGLQNKPTSHAVTRETRHTQSNPLWKAAILIGGVLLLIGVVVPVVAIAMIAGSRNFRSGISQNANIPKADLSNLVKPPQTKTSIVPPSQKPNRSTNSIPHGSPNVEDKRAPQRPRGNANVADSSAIPTPRFEPPNMNQPKSDPPKMDPPNSGFDRPGFPGFGPPPGMMFGPGGNSMPSSSADEIAKADGVRIFITNAKGLKTREVVDKLRKDLDVSGHTARSSGSEMSIELRFSGAIQKIVERIDFGKIVELDQENRVIRIEANVL